MNELEGKVHKKVIFPIYIFQKFIIQWEMLDLMNVCIYILDMRTNALPISMQQMDAVLGSNWRKGRILPIKAARTVLVNLFKEKSSRYWLLCLPFAIIEL